MSKNMRLLLVIIALIGLSGCVSREQADARLAKGCQAGVQALLPEGLTIDRIKETSFAPSPEGQGLRHVTITTVTLDGWLETEKVYECIFEESFGFLKTNHTASIYQVRTGSHGATDLSRS